jgi:hypothetical protein
LKGYLAGSIIEADLELIKDSFVTQDIETNSETLGKSDWGIQFPLIDLDGEIMEIGRNEAAVANDDHLLPALLPIYSNALCVIYT